MFVQVSLAKFKCTSVDSMCTITIQYHIAEIFMGENFCKHTYATVTLHVLYDCTKILSSVQNYTVWSSILWCYYIMLFAFHFKQ